MKLDHLFRQTALIGCLLLTTVAEAESPPASEAGSDTRSLPPVVVTASPLSTDPDFLATIVDVVRRSEILEKGGANLADSLSDVPGVTGTGFAAGASRPVIRGFDAQRVRTLEDGIGSFDVSDVGPDHGVPIDPLSAQQIEVVRGAATMRYGSQAIGGVVNAINNRVPTELPDRPLSGEVTGSYGTNANAVQGSALLDGKVDHFAFHLDGFDRNTGDYDIPDGHQDNSFFHGDGYSAGGSYFFGTDDDPSHVGAAVVHYDSKYGIPSDTTHIDMRQTKELFRSSFVINSGALQAINVDGGHADYQHTENEPDGSVDSTFKDTEWDGRAEALFGPTGPLSGSALGIQAQKKNFSALGEDSDYLFPTITKTQAVFGFAEAPLSQAMRLQFGARVESVDIDGTPASDVPTSRSLTPVSASVGAVYDVNDTVRLGLTAASAARAPAQTELFARGAHDGPGTFETGDPALKIERSNSLEGTIRIRREDVRFDGAVWGAKFDRYIYGRLTGQTCDEDGVCVGDGSQEFKELFYSQDDATFFGAEGKTTIALGEGPAGRFEAVALADYVRAKLDEGGNVPRIPPYHVGAGFNWTRDAFDGGLLAKYTGSQHDVAVDETPTGGFMSVDARLGWHSSGRPGLNVALVARNLTNSTQRDAVAINKDDVILPGRDVRLLASMAF